MIGKIKTVTGREISLQYNYLTETTTACDWVGDMLECFGSSCPDCKCPECPFDPKNLPVEYQGNITAKLFMEYFKSLLVKE